MARPTSRSSDRSAPKGAARDGAPSAAAAVGAPAEPDVQRLGIPINPDGSLAADRIRPSTREALRKLVSDDRTSAALGLNQPKVDATPVISPAFGKAIAHGIASIDLAIVARITNASPAILDKVKWTELEIAVLQGPLTDVLSKYGGSWLGKFEAEIGLAVILIAVTQTKIAAVRSLMEEQRTARVVPFPSAAPTDAPATDVASPVDPSAASPDAASILP
jgi:hypothetical protein